MEQKQYFNNFRERIRGLLEQLSAGIYERDEALAMALLSAIAGESIFLLGLPGVGKSLVARRLKLAFHKARSFEYLMSRFSTPDEVFGPVSISKLKDEDVYERLTEGYLPSADIVFLDEIWKAGPAIQNTLLTVLNEKLFRNGEQEIRLPLKAIIAASNELPACGEGLEALWDRFLVRLVIPPLESDKAFRAMVTGKCIIQTEITPALQIMPEEYADWQWRIDEIEVGDDILELIAHIRAFLKQPSQAEDKEVLAAIYVSDRRWKKIVRLLRTAAFLNGRCRINRIDCFLIGTTIWNVPEQLEYCIQETDRIIIDAITSDFKNAYAAIDVKQLEIKENILKTIGPNLQLVSPYRIINNRYYRLAGYPEGQMLIKIEDYKALQPHTSAQATVLAKAEDTGILSPGGNVMCYPRSLRLNISKEPEAVVIQNISYPLERGAYNPLKQSFPEAYEQLEEQNRQFDILIASIETYIRGNLAKNKRSPFIGTQQISKLKTELSRLMSRIRKRQNTLFQITSNE